MGGACNTYESREVYTGIWWGNLMEGAHLGYRGIYGRILFR